MNEYTSGARRKLVAESVLKTALDRRLLGVPTARIVRDLELDICRPTFDKLLYYYSLIVAKHDPTIYNSLFPPWLLKVERVQTSPHGWKYKGRFPYGKWLESV